MQEFIHADFRFKIVESSSELVLVSGRTGREGMTKMSASGTSLIRADEPALPL